MMTTESTQVSTYSGAGVLLGAAGCGLLATLLTTAAALAVAGPEAALTTLAAGGVAVVVIAAGAVTLDVVAAVMPAMSLLVALLTYVLQLIALTIFFATLSGHIAADARGWAAVVVVVATLATTLSHLKLAGRARIPVYDLTTRAGAR
ncbi:hypothetical protein [Nocardioides sp.]|uniref:hypothetical protein n=1 Tax=Nocardioides sp. TaxID=35761 RepID=UPI0039E4E543